MKKAKPKRSETKDQEPKPRNKVTLDWLLANVTPENLHPETDWGPPVGKERWWE